MVTKRLSLTEIFNAEGGDKGSFFTHTNSEENIAHNYTEVYEKIMDSHRDKKISMLEIGLWCPFFPGSSVRGWNKYFTSLNYFGIDIEEQCKTLEDKDNNINISIVNQKSAAELKTFIKGKPKFNFIIDDGCHQADAIIISLGALFPQLKKGGTYVIEDLHVVDKVEIYKLGSGKFTSDLISKEEVDYINSEIKECYFEKDDKMCIIVKK